MAYTLNKPYTDRERMNFIVLYNHQRGLLIEETHEALYALEANEIMIDGHPEVDPDYEEKQRQKEKARIMELSMTRSDFFDGTIKAFGADDTALFTIIQTMLNQSEMTEIEKKIALNNFKNALNFYRKHPLFTVLSGVPIPIAEGVTIVITETQWDKFFDETDKKNPNAYQELLPAVVPTTEPTEEPTVEPTIEPTVEPQEVEPAEEEPEE